MLTVLLDLKKYEKQVRSSEKKIKSVEIERGRNTFLVPTVDLIVS